MNLHNLLYSRNQSECTDIELHLNDCSSSFFPKLSSYVNISEYSLKLFNHSIREEVWEKEILVGLVAYYHQQNEKKAFISNVSILPIYQRRGLAKALMDRAIFNCIKGGIQLMTLEVPIHNSAAYYLYSKLGFRKVLDGELRDTLELSLRSM